jgi:hypothetical protein
MGEDLPGNEDSNLSTLETVTTMYVCMSVMKCIVTKLQMVQTSTLAQIYLVTIEIDLPSDVGKNSAILAAGFHKLNFRRSTFENSITFEPFEISTSDWRYCAQD